MSKIFIIFMYIGVVCMCACVSHVCNDLRGQKSLRYPDTGVKTAVRHEMGTSPLEEQF